MKHEAVNECSKMLQRGLKDQCTQDLSLWTEECSRRTQYHNLRTQRNGCNNNNISWAKNAYLGIHTYSWAFIWGTPNLKSALTKVLKTLCIWLIAPHSCFHPAASLTCACCLWTTHFHQMAGAAWGEIEA